MVGITGPILCFKGGDESLLRLAKSALRGSGGLSK